VNYTYAIERTAAQTVFASSGRERRLLRLAIEEIAGNPMHTPTFRNSTKVDVSSLPVSSDRMP
jgi:hypothetical protein